MFPIVLAGLCLLIAAVAFTLWLRDADPARVAGALKRSAFWGALVVGGALAAYLVATGKVVAAIGALIAAAPLLFRGRDLWRRAKAARGPRAGAASDVETRFLRMRLDHDSGAVDGAVIAGPFAGRPLHALSAEDFGVLLADCDRDDPPSARLLRAWRDRVRPEWGDAGDGSASASAGGPMSEAEALAVLGLDAGATEAEIKAAHRRIMRSAHPDAGGSDWLAARVNAAKARLLSG